MSIFELDPEGQRSVAEEAQTNGFNVSSIPPSFFEGTATGIGQGVMRGGARAGQFLGMAAAAPVALLDKVADTDYADHVFRALDSTVNSAVDYWTPDANSVGTAGRVLGGLSEIALPLMAGAGNPALLIGSQEMGTATDLVRQGADPKAAIGTGIVQGASTAIGFKIPFVGKTFLGKVASGAAGNLVTNAGASAISRQLLRSTGDDALPEQFDPFNAEARLVDVLTGIAFGGLAHISAPSVRDAAIATANAKHFQQDTAPGIPADAASSVAHQNAMEVATRDLLEGKPVEVAHTAVGDAQFLKSPDSGLAPEVQSTISGYDSEPTQDKTADVSLMPPVKDGSIRFYHGGGKYEGGPRWLTEDPIYARDYRQGGILHYVDVPEAELERRGISKSYDDTGLSQRAPYVHFDAPEEIARGLKPVDSQVKAIRRTPAETEKAPVVTVQLPEGESAPPKAKAPEVVEVDIDTAANDVATKSEAVPVDPIVASAHEIATQVDHQIPIADENGNITTMSSRQLLADSAAAMKQAEIDSKGFLAAATCFLQVGA